jgi:5-methylthioadenosine/S-adenosylhomocysteine deaminase
MDSRKRPQMTTLIRNAMIISMDAIHGATPFEGSILIEDGRITRIGSGVSAGADCRVIAGEGKLVTPGLINAHTHSAEMFLRGRYEKLPLELWLLYAYPFLRSSVPPKRVLYLRSMLLAMESIRSGVTTVVDHFFDPPRHDIERLAEAVRAYDEIGIRAVVSSAMMDIHPLDALPFARDVVPRELQDLLSYGAPISPQAYTDYCSSAVSAFHGHKGRISFMMAPSAPQRCSPDMMQACRDFAAAKGIPYHSHVLETKAQAVTGDLLYGKSLIAYMRNLDLLHPNTTIAHGVWLNDEDIDLLAEAGVSVVHNVIANLKLGSGIAPVRRMMDAGLNVALGSDGAASNDTVRILDAMRVAALVHSQPDRHHDQWLSAADVLSMATLNGARSAGLERTTGSIEVGKAADLVIFNLDTVAFTPRNTLAHHLVYAENGSSIERVMVAGVEVFANGRLTQVDERALLRDIREAAAAFLQDHAADEARNAIYEPSFAEIHRRAAARWSDIGTVRKGGQNDR